MATHKRRSTNTKKRFLTAPMQLFLAILLFVVSAASIQNLAMTEAEVGIFHFFYGLDFLTPFFYVITYVGNIYVFLVIILLLLLKRYYHIAVRLLMAGSLAYVLSGVAKDLIGRARPDEYINDIVYRDLEVRGSSFPSGHVALATAIAMTISLYLPQRYKWIPPTIIILVGISRMQLGVHGPVDIVGGFALGWAVVTLLSFVSIDIALMVGKRKQVKKTST